MKRITTIVLFASIFAVAVGTLGLSGNATTLMVSPALQTQENVGMLGHVEFKVIDEFGQVKQYMQNDNIVVIAGVDCAAQYLFGPTGSSPGDCLAFSGSPDAFTYIGIGNGSSVTVDTLNATLADVEGDNNTGTCSASGGVGTFGGGDMARRNVTAGILTGSTESVVTLNTDTAFTFDISNATTVFDSGLFNADYGNGSPVNGQCPGTQTAGLHWNMFARQLLNNPNGITVTEGDSLSVKWTITIS